MLTRDELLARLDSAHLSRFHWKATIVAGMGFLTDAYDLFVIGTVMLLIGKDSSIGKGSIFAANFAGNQALIGSSALIASFIGALIFGTVADRVGRRVIYGVELLVLAVGAILAALSPNLTWLILVRFVLGIGIGGDYPVSATIISEHANQQDRGKLISTVFAMQAVGIVSGYVFALVILGLGVPPNVAWRLLLGLGAVPALATFWLRRQLPESPRFLLHVRSDVHAANEALRHHHGNRPVPAAGSRRVAKPQRNMPWSWRILFSSPRMLLMLVGAAGAWFLLDYAYYGNTISSPVVIDRVLGKATPFQTTLAGFVIVVLFAVPGYVAAILTVDRIGRKAMQVLGFAIMTLTFGAIALLPAVRDSIVVFGIVFGLSYFFTEFGPNTTTFLYPAEIFPTAVRTTAHGIAAGIAKIGAFAGVLLFPFLQAQGGGKNLPLAVGVAALAAFVGLILTLATLPEPNQQSLEAAERAAWTATHHQDTDSRDETLASA